MRNHKESIFIARSLTKTRGIDNSDMQYAGRRSTGAGKGVPNARELRRFAAQPVIDVSSHSTGNVSLPKQSPHARCVTPEAYVVPQWTTLRLQATPAIRGRRARRGKRIGPIRERVLVVRWRRYGYAGPPESFKEGLGAGIVSHHVGEPYRCRG